MPPPPGPGSVVTVPEVPADEKTDVARLITDVVQIITAAATLTLTIVALSR